MTPQQLQEKANALRRDVVRMIGVNKPGHVGGSCSIADVVAVLYYEHLRHDPKNPQWPDRDRFLLSKGHAAIVQYAAMADLGYFPKEWLGTLKDLGSPLQGHPDMRKVPGVEANTGSLGQGLSIACGMAAGLKLDHKDARVYCVVGDGELAEGQIWEAAMAANVYKLDNLCGILDYNRLQAMGAVRERFNTEPYAEKWTAFGWQVIEINGHDIEDIRRGLAQARGITGKPTMLIAHTVKGKGFPFSENVVAFHNGAMTQEQYDLALKQ